MIQCMLAAWSLVPLSFINPALTCGSSWFMYRWRLTWRILSITFIAGEMSTIVQQFEHSLSLPFWGIEMKTNVLQSHGHCWVFQTWHIECSTLTASSFRIWNSSAEIPSPTLALFIVMLPKAHLTLYSRMSGWWVTTPPWFSGSLRPFLFSSSMHSFPLFLNSSAAFRSLTFPLLHPSLHEVLPWQFSWRYL